MATQNPFDLLGEDDSDDLSSLLIAAKQQQKLLVETKKSQTPAAQLQQSKPAAKLPSKPVPPAQAGQLVSYTRYLYFFSTWNMIDFLDFIFSLTDDIEYRRIKRVSDESG